MKMKAHVNEETCIGCGLCEQMCPAVFVMDGATARVQVDPVPADQEAVCREAADACPVAAIEIEE
jgi:ferredoxin